MTNSDVENWIDAYESAWRSSNAQKLNDIFSENINYSLSPWKSELQGLAELKKFWQKTGTKSERQFETHSRIVAIQNKTAVVRVEVQYTGDTPSSWRDLWIITFDSNGLCSHFEEWPFSPVQNDGQK